MSPTPEEVVAFLLGPLDEPTMAALCDVLEHDARQDEEPAFAFRKGWWTWENPISVEYHLLDGPTLGWARRAVGSARSDGTVTS